MELILSMRRMNKIIGKDQIVSIELISPNKWNPKESIEDNEENKERYLEVKKEIETQGLYEAITVREVDSKFEIIDGYHRWRACNELGFKEMRVNNLGEVSEANARIITLNKEKLKIPLSELLVGKLVKELSELVPIETLPDMIHLPLDTVNEYIALDDFDFGQFDHQEVEPLDSPKQVTCPKCGEVFNI